MALFLLRMLVSVSGCRSIRNIRFTMSGLLPQCHFQLNERLSASCAHCLHLVEWL